MAGETDGHVTLRKNAMSVSDALQAVRQQTGMIVMYETGTVNAMPNISLNLNSASLKDAMDAICGQAGLQYEINGRYVLVTRNAKLVKGGKGHSHVTGRIVDDTGEPLIGATVMVVGKNVGTITDANGHYSIRADAGDRLRFSYIGMKSIERTVGKANVLNVAFDSRSHNLREVEVVSTGYQTLPKDRATGSFATLSVKDLKKVTTPNVVQRLEGQVAGMKVNVLATDRTFAYANPTQSLNSSTRTLGASDYAYSIRGENTFSAEQMPLLVVDGVISDIDISNIDPNNIENITVLKDAAAASIWGSRAANGVITITTKKGQQGQRPQVAFNMTLTTQGRPDLSNLRNMNSAQLLDYERELTDRGVFYKSAPTDYYSAQSYFHEGVRLALDLKDGTISQQQYDSEVARLSAIDNHSQISEYLLQPATSQQYGLSVNGGGANSTYFYSASYSKENTNTKGNDGSRLNLNLANTWKLFNWATLTTNFTGTFFKYKNNGIGFEAINNTAYYALIPYHNIVDENGKGIDYDYLNPAYTSTLGAAYQPWTYNYLQEQALKDDTQRTDNYTANISLNVPIIAGLNSQTTYAIERSYSRSEVWYDPQSFYMRDMLNYYTPIGAAANTLGIRNGGLNKRHTDNRNWTFREQLNFDHTFGGIHRVNALAGMELRETYAEQGGYTIWGYNRDTGLSDTNIDYSSNAQYGTIAGYATSFSKGGYPDDINRKRRFLSYYANANYTLFDRYYLSGSVRYDDYNNFGLSRKYRAKPFYSFGGKWNMSREAFMQDTKWVNNLALRVTYGINGNISLSSYPFTKLNVVTNYITNQPSYGISAVANPELRWEKTGTFNLGVDFSLFGSRLNGSIDYYDKRSRDLLYDFPISSAIVGNIYNQTMQRNAAAINAHGIDVNLNGVAFRDKDWNVRLGGNLSWNTNKVQKNQFFKEEQYASQYNYNPAYLGPIEGYPTDKMFAYRWAGLDTDGQPMVYGKDGRKIKATEKISDLDDLVYVGHSTPTVYGGLNLNVTWRQFTLYALFTYQFGSKFFRPTVLSYVTNAYSKWDLNEDIARRWRKPGDEQTTNVPGLTSNYVAVPRYAYSDINVEKGDYLRWRQLSLAYNVSQDLLKKVHLSTASLTLGVNNIGLLWKANHVGIDPDYSMPPRTGYSLTLNVGF